MPTAAVYKAPFYPQCYYHIVFRSIDGLPLFKSHDNHLFLLQKFSHFLHPFCSCLAYCLLDNHVHFIVRIKEKEEITDAIRSTPNEIRTTTMKRFINETEIDVTDYLIERQANSFMVSYVNAYNKYDCRKGGLFQSPFRRVEIKDESHLQQAIIYTHANAQKHGLIGDFKEYTYSSYWEILNNNSSNVNVWEVLAFFGGREKFCEIHQQQVDYFYSKNWPSSKLE